MIKIKLAQAALTLSLLATASVASAASAWPASTTSTSIGSGITGNSTGNGFEASGIDYLSGTGYIVVGDDGDIAVLTTAGVVSQYWNRYQATENDFEDITVTDTSATDNKMYIANEYSNKIEELYISTGVKTGLSWTLSDLPISGGSGFEALTYVPAAYAPASWGTAQSGGFFLAASQAETVVRVYTFSRSSSSSSVSSVATITLMNSATAANTYYDISSLQYNSSTNVLYVVFDSDSRLKEYSLTGTLLQTGSADRSYYMPTYGTLGTDGNAASEEGLVIVPNCTTGLAQAALTVDNIPSSVAVYSNYPVTCTAAATDADNDGVASTSDCNDNDATISSNVTYYRDADGDGRGLSASTTSVCSLTAPSGYVSTATDLNDADYDNDGVSTTADCNDADSTVSSNLTVYQDYDNDGLGNAAVSQTVCALTAPTGYVTNSSDTDDSGVVTVPPVETTPAPTYSVIEYISNRIDDDGDGLIDEWNTLASNGVHPIYGSYSASSKTLYKQTVTSIAGGSNGTIKVKFVDGSGYRYTVLSQGNTSVTSQNGTAYLLVRSGKKYALVNAYTGQVLDSLRTTSSVKVHLKTLSLHRK